MYLAGSNFLKRQQQYKAIQDNSLALKIKLSQQANQEMAPFWTQKQQSLYPNSTSITPSQPVDQALISNSTIADKLNNPTDVDAVTNQAEQNILNLTSNDPNATDYVLNQLNYEDMAAFNQYFGKIKLDLKKTFPKGRYNQGSILFVFKNKYNT